MRISDWSSDVCSSDLLSTREKGSNQAFRHLFKHVLRQMGRGGDPLKLGAHQPAIGMVESPPAAKRRDEARGRLRIDPVHAQDHVRAIGRGSCRERGVKSGEISLVDGSLNKK